jgi:hypothetical protein
MTDAHEDAGRSEPVELTSKEAAALAALPGEREPGELLEERVVRSLRAEGLLAEPEGRRGGRRSSGSRAERDRFWWRSGAAAAAGVALFVGGLSLGQAMGVRQTADAFHTAFENGDTRLASQVQRTGSDYVAALSALADTDGATSTDSSQALEVALTALWAAANQIVRLAPDDPLTARILQGFEARAREADGYGTGGQLLVEF